MTVAAPLAGLFGLVVPAIVALYLLKVRRRQVPLSSTLLWRRAVRDRQAAVPWQRLRPSWLLVLQVLAAALVVAALVRPALASAPALVGHTIVVIDASEPMQATDVPPSRFAVAQADALHLVSRLGPHSAMTIIALDDRPRVLASATGDRAVLRRAVEGLRVTSGGADLQGALELAASVAGTGASTRAVVLSDGITEPLVDPLTLPFTVQYRPIGATGENLAVTSLSPPERPGQEAVVHVQSFGRLRHSTTVELWADGRLVDARSVKIGPGASTEVSFAVPAGAGELSASLSPHDALAVDDTAAAVVRSPRPVRVVLVTRGDVFLSSALQLRPGVRLTTEAPGSYHADPAADLWVFDGFLPPVLPAAPYLLVDPPPDARLGVGRAVSPGRLAPAAPGDPLLSDVDLSDVHVARSADLRGSSFGRAVVTSDAGPLLLVRDGSPPAALVGFDLHHSDLVLRAAFPILVANLSRFLVPELVPSPSQEPGTPVEISAGPRATRVTVTRPDGAVTVLRKGGRPSGDAAASLLDTDTSEVGLYRVAVSEANGSTERSALVVNGFDPARSAIAPRARLDLAGSSQAALRAAGPVHGRAPPVSRDLWPLAVILALLVLSGEWVVFHRGA